MKIGSQLYRKIMSNKHLSRLLAKLFCKIHSFAYAQLGYFATNAEPDLLHPKHRLTKYHQFFVDHIHKKDCILDVGCGNGALSFSLAKKAKKVIGIDINRANIESAQKQFQRKNLQFMTGDITKKVFSGQFDVIVLSNVLEHIKNRNELLQSLTRNSKKILIRVPQYDRSWDVLYKQELGLDYRLDPTHELEYTYELLEHEVNDAQLKIVERHIKFGEFWIVCEFYGKNK